MSNIQTNFTEGLKDFAFWGKRAVESLEQVDTALVAEELYRLVASYDKAFSTRLFRSIEKGSKGEEVLKNQIAALVDIAQKTILTNKTLEEVKTENSNIEKEVWAVLEGVTAADYDDIAIFYSFLNNCSQPIETILAKELRCPASIKFEDGFSTLIYYLKEWLGYDYEDNFFKDEQVRVEALEVEFQNGGEDFYNAFCSDAEYDDDYPTYSDGYREMYYDHFRHL